MADRDIPYLVLSAETSPDSDPGGPDSSWWRKWLPGGNGSGPDVGGALAGLVEILETVPAGIAVFDANGRMQNFNTADCEIFPEIADIVRPGIPLETLVRTAYRRGIRHVEGEVGAASEDLENEEKFVAQAIGRHRMLPTSIKLKVGDDRWVQLKKVQTPDGRIVAIYTKSH